MTTMDAKTALARGRPGVAFDLARHGTTPALQYLASLAAARGGNPDLAEITLGDLPEKALADVTLETGLRVDIVALRGRIEKDRKQFAAAITWYERAAAIPGADTFPLINAATLHRVAGDSATATRIATVVAARAEACLAQSPDDLWLHATLGEACVLLGRHDDAVRHYLRSVDLALVDPKRRHEGHLNSMRANLALLKEAGATADAAFLEERIGSVVAFTGHMIDAPGRTPPRFPPSPGLEAAVAAAIRTHLDAMNATVGYSSLANGSDILFAEAMLERGAELHVVLPFATADFLRTSVDFGLSGPPWDGWRRRFERILDRVNQDDALHFATTEPYLRTTDLFALANIMAQGMAAVRARQRLSTPRALAVLDPASSPQSGGARHFVDAWRAAGFPADEIDLAALATLHPVPVSVTSVAAAATAPSSPLPRALKAILFADLKGSGQIPEDRQAEFLVEYIAMLKQLFQSEIGQPAVFANTWGDGLFVVFDAVPAAAAFALELLARAARMGKGVTYRVGLHYGPVFAVPDPFRAAPNYGGQHVTLAARIEPATLPGCVYTSEQFAAALTLAAGTVYRCEYVGRHTLQKEKVDCGLYHVKSTATRVGTSSITVS